MMPGLYCNGSRNARAINDVAEFSEHKNNQGIWTQNTAIALLATEYVKEDIMGRNLINELGEERYQASHT